MFPRLRSPPVPAAAGLAVVESTASIGEVDVTRFARFVGALTGSSDVVFRVYKPDDSEVLQAVISRDGDVELSVLVGDEPAAFAIAVERDVAETNGEKFLLTTKTENEKTHLRLSFDQSALPYPTAAGLLPILSAYLAGAPAPELLTRWLVEPTPESKTSVLSEFAQSALSHCASTLCIPAADIAAVLPATPTTTALLPKFWSDKASILHTVHALSAETDAQKLVRTWQTVLHRHDAARTLIAVTDSPVSPFAACVLTAEAAPEIPVYSAGTLAAARTTAEEKLGIKTAPVAIGVVGTSQLVVSVFTGLIDAGAVRLLQEEVAAEYSGAAAPVRTELSAATRAHFEADTERNKAFWQTYVGGVEPEPFPVLSGRSSAVVQNIIGRVTAPSQLSWAEMQRQCRALGVSPLSVLQAAWAVMLSAFSESMAEDVVMGCVHPSRDAVTESCVGALFNTVPVRVSLAPRDGVPPTNASVLAALDAANMDALAHLQTPLRSMVTADGALPFDSTVEFVYSAPVATSLWTEAEADAVKSDFPITITVAPTVSGSLQLAAIFKDTHTIEPEALMILQQLDDIMAHILSHPAGSIRDSFAGVREDLSGAGNRKPVENNIVPFLHSQFENHARDHPDDIALVYKTDLKNPSDPGNIEWTYAELNRRANRLANELVRRFGPLNDVAVPVCVEKTPALYIAILGVLKSGAGWCPIGVDFPVRRRHDLIARTGAKMLVVAGNTANQPAEGVPEGVEIVNIDEALLNGLDEQPAVECKTENLAYLIWTSGTTGPPKGVPIEHHSGVASMTVLQHDIPTDVEGGVRCLQFAAYTFDVFVQDLFYTWGVGGTLISSSHPIMIGSLAALATSTRATHAHLTPAYAAGVPRKSCPTLKVITMIGERLGDAVAQDWAQDMRAYNTYGPAEATVVSTLRQFKGKDDDLKAHNVGVPMSSVSCYLIRHGKVILKGGVGELALGGPHLTRGYLNDPKKSAEKLVFDPEIGEKVYLTGDIVRYLHNGTIEFVGRTDDQVKLGGIRIELSEISAAIKNFHPLAERVETMHIGRPDRPAKVLVTFISAPSLPDAEGRAIQSAPAVEIARAAIKMAQSELPEFMLPSVYVVINRIPVTPSNKIDRVALRNAYASLDMDLWETQLRASEEKAASSGLTREEQIIAEMVSSITDMPADAIKPTAGLRALGIDSIRAIQLTAALTEKGHEVSMVHVLRSKTIKELASHLTPSSPAEAAVEKKDLNPRVSAFNTTLLPAVRARFPEVQITRVLPASPLQDGLISESLRTPGAYWSNWFYELSPKISLPRLQSAWEKAAAGNEALRTGFLPVGVLGETNTSGSSATFLQLIREAAVVSFAVVETTVPELEAAAKKCASEIADAHDFALPPWAVTVLDAGEKRLMMLTLHHAIHDGPSIAYIAGDVQAAYLGYPLPSRTQLSEAVAVTYPSAEAEQQSREFWERELKEYADPEANIFPDLTGKKQEIKEGARKEYLYKTIPLSVPPVVLSAAAQELGSSSTAALVQTAWGILLADYLESPSVVYGSTLSSRIQHPSLTSAVAPLITVLPCPARTNGTARELLAEQTRRSQELIQHHHISPGEIRRILQRPRDQALYPATYVFHPAEDDDSVLFAAWEEAPDIVGLTVEHPLALNVYADKKGALKLEFSADTVVMGMPQLEVLARQVDALVSAMIVDPDVPVAELVKHFPADLLSVASSRASKGVQDAFTDSPTKWVEQYAAEHPSWPAALVASEITHRGAVTKQWDYATLNAEANRVANFISLAGVRQRMIAVCVGRTLEAYATILGVIKSGNTYLPVDESLPVARKVLLVEDSDAAILFTTAELSASFREHGIPGGCRLVVIDEEPFVSELAYYSPENRVALQNNPHDPVYLLYTSGSTGKPKGVIVTRGNLSGFVESQWDFFREVCPATAELGGKGRYLGLASRAFDVHVAEMFLAWRYGFAACTAKRSMLLDDLGLALQKLNITHASFVPSLLDQADLVPEDVPLIKYLSVGGEKISQRVLDTWAASDSVALVNAYGPTEVTICCSALKVKPDHTVRNIGHLVGHITGYVFVPGTTILTKRGQPGELCVTGDLVAKGYYQRPDAGGFFEFEGTTLYRTGDMVRLMLDDTIEYLGRSDDQAKIRGQRLELGEVSEGVRGATDEPLDIASLVVKHPELSRQQLVTFVARAADRQKYKDQAPEFVAEDYDEWVISLQNSCKERMPAYMVPDTIIPITIMPLAPMSGKADAKQLRALFGKIPLNQLLRRGGAEGVEEKPSRELDEEEEKVRDALLSVVKVDPTHVRFNSSVFEFGIDSLSAITLSARLKAKGINASVVDVMTKPVIEQLAKVGATAESVEEEKKKAALALQKLKETEKKLKPVVAGIAGVKEEDVKAVMPCLPLQEGIVARSLNSETGPTYVNHVVLKLDSGVDAARLQQAWKDTVLANDILNTIFVQPEEDILQVVLRSGLYFSFTTIDAEDAVAAAESERLKVAAEIIDNLNRLPPIRLQLFKQADQALLAVSIHHSIYDGESFIMLLDEVYARYQAEPVPERAPSSSLVEYLATQNPQRMQSFWKTYLKDVRPTHAASASGYRDNDSTVGLSERKISAKLSSLEKYASTLKSTLPSVTQTIFGVLLAQRLGHGDVVFGSVLSGRTIPVQQVETILAPCITTIPFRVNMLKTSGSASVDDVVQDVHKASVKALEWQHTSLRHIQRWVGADKPLFDCLFSYVRAMGNLRTSALWKELNSEIVPDYPFAIEFEANPDADELMIRAAFTPAFGAQEEVDMFMEKIDILLAGLVNGEVATLKSLGVAGLNSAVAEDTVEKFDEATWTKDELTIRKLLAALTELPEESIRKSDSFFKLGVDSVTAIRLARRIRNAGIEVSSSEIIRHPSIGAISELLVSKNGAAAVKETQIVAAKELALSAADVPKLSDEDVVESVYSCTPLQAGMLTHTLASDGKLYAHHHAVVLTQVNNLPRLENAWKTVVARTDILRTTFHAVEDSWAAAVHSSPAASWSFEEKKSLDDLVEEFRFVSVESFAVPPVKATVLKKGDEYIFVVSMHHALYDGNSVPLIFNDLARAYSGDALPARPLFSDAAALIAQSTESNGDFWPATLKDYTAVHLPQLPAEEASSEVFVQSKTLSIDPATIVAKCKTLEATFQSVALLAWSKVLSTVYARRDIVFGHVVAGRSLQMDSAEDIIGPLFNTVPFRMKLDQGLQTNADAVRNIQQFTAESQAHQHASLRGIQNAWRKQTGSSEAALFDTLFVFQKVDDSDAPEVALWKPLDAEGAEVQAEYGINLEIEHGDKNVTISAASQGEYLSAAGLAALLETLEETILEILNNPTRSVLAHPTVLRSLPVTSVARSSADDEDDATPFSPEEETIRNTMAEVAGVPVEKITRKANIYSFGLDSIAAITLATRLRRAGLQCGVADILQGGSVAGIAARILTSRAPAEPLDTTPLVSADVRNQALATLKLTEDNVEDVLPVLPGQLHHLEAWLQSGRTAYENTFTFAAKDRLDPDRLRLAWRQLRERHAILRTVFAATSPTTAVQVILTPTTVTDSSFHFRRGEGALLEHAAATVASLAASPSDLFSPPVRLTLLRCADKDAVFLTLHHAVYDGFSIPLLLSDLTTLYTSPSTPLPTPPSFAAYITHTLRTTSPAAATSYWRTALASAQPTLIPTTPTPPFLKLFPNTIPNFSRLAATCKTHNIPLQNIVLHAVARALAEATNTTTPVLGLYQSARSADFDGVHTMAAPTLNITPLAVADAASRDPKAAADAIRSDLAARVPFEQSYPADIAAPAHNVYVNLLWHTAEMRGEDDGWLQHVDVGMPQVAQVQKQVTPVDALEVALAEGKVFVDVGPSVRGDDGIDLGVKSEHAWTEAQVEAFVAAVKRGVEEAVAGLA